jgi:SAM-dependent methyltransferase
MNSLSPCLSHKERASYRPASLPDCLTYLKTFFDAFADVHDGWRYRTRGYHDELLRTCRYHIPDHSSVLEVGCGTGDLLAGLNPSRGLGIDLSPKMIERAKTKHPSLDFRCSAAETFTEDVGTFDYIVLSDVLAYTYDILILFKSLKPFCHARTRLIINVHSRLWQPILSLAEFIGLKYRHPVMNWVTREDVTAFLGLSGFETIQHYTNLLCPLHIPLFSRLVNRLLSPLAPFKWFSLVNWVVARYPMPPLAPGLNAAAPEPSVTVVCPCRNEAGNIPEIVRRLPIFGKDMELIFVEGNSNDNTYEACLAARDENPDRGISVYRQPGRGKKDAVWLGFSKARGDVLMILDADMTVPPEDLPSFYQVLAEGRAEFVNGSRLVYAMEGEAMRFLNLMANKFFSKAFSFLLGQPIKDTLCGTKVLLRSDFVRLLANQPYFGQFDPFGDFDLIFGAAKLGLKISDLPIRYRRRSYGETQISRFRHGIMLFKMCAVGLFRLKLK